MTKAPLLTVLAAACLAGCVESGIKQPLDAPRPSSPDQVLVDKEGCTWWVIGNVSNLTWSPRIDPEGNHICDRNLDGITMEDVIDAGAEISAAPTMTAAADPVEVAPAPEQVMVAPIEAPKPAAPMIAAPAPAPSVDPAPAPEMDAPIATSGQFIQVASFGQQSNATQSAALFRSLGLPVEQGGEQKNSRGLYRLVLGPFQTEADMAKGLAAAKAEGFSDAYRFTQ